MDTPKSYEIRAGTTDFGKDYESKIAAILLLRCIKPETLDMWLAMNAKGFGPIDDIILCRKTAASIIIYLLQLKHQNTSKFITKAQFLSDTGDFSLEKYGKHLVKIYKKAGVTREECDILKCFFETSEQHFVIFTNKGVYNYPFLKPHEESNLEILKVGGNQGGNIHKFDYTALQFEVEEEARHCYEKIVLFTSQPHVVNLNSIIENLIKDHIYPLQLQKRELVIVAEKFALFVTEWSKGILGGFYPLRMEHLLRVMVGIILELYMIDIRQPETSSTYQTTIWDDIVKDRPVTIIGDVDNVTEQFIKAWIHSVIDKHRNTKLCEKSRHYINRNISARTEINEMDYEGNYEYLWKNGEVPLVLEVSSSETIQNILHILKKYLVNLHVVILHKSLDKSPKLNVQGAFCSFEDLSEQHQNKILKYSITLQGRQSVKLNAFPYDILNHLTSKDIIDVFCGKFNIGKEFEPLQNVFVERSLSRVFLRAEVLQNASNDVFVIQCSSPSDFQKYLQKHNITTDLKFCSYASDTNLTTEDKIILICSDDDRACIEKHFENLRVHHLKLHDQIKLEWLKSNGTITSLRPYQASFALRHDLKDITISNFEYHLPNLVCAMPGMGKSTILDYIACNTPASIWVLKIKLNELIVNYYETTCFEELEVSDILYDLHRMKNENCRNLELAVFGLYLKSKNILLLLDGFDEIPIEYQPRAMNMIQYLHRTKYPVLITTRSSYKVAELEELLCTFAVTLNPLSREDQVNFLRNYFAEIDDSSDLTLKCLTSFINSVINVAVENRLDNDFTKVPLHLKWLAEAFVYDYRMYLQTNEFTNNNFDLLYFFKCFVRQKLEIAVEKFGINGRDMVDQYRTHKYMYALKEMFAEKDLKELEIEEYLQSMIKHCKNSLLYIQKDGIVMVENESKVTFIHSTLAQYLVAEWLVTNLSGEHKQIAQILVKKIQSSNKFLYRLFYDFVYCSSDI